MLGNGMPNGAGFHDYEEIYPVSSDEEESIEEFLRGSVQKDLDTEVSSARDNQREENFQS